MIVAATMTYLSMANAQSIPVETFIGAKNYWYQHVVVKQLPEKRLGFFHVSSLYAFYDKTRGEELMSQSYITYALVPGIKLAVGSFYANVPGFSPSAAIQFYKKVDDLTILVVPRADLSSKPAVETMIMLEFRPRLTRTVGLYARVQAMSSMVNARHNRSYQSMRLGIDIKKVQFGLALSIDEYGPETVTRHNSGVFIRTELL